MEDHLQNLREDQDQDDGSDNGWDGWDVESDNSEESESEGWMDVDSGGEDHLEFSDSEDDRDKSGSKKDTKPAEVEFKTEIEDGPDPDRVSTLATTKVRQICSNHLCVLTRFYLDSNTCRFCSAK